MFSSSSFRRLQLWSDAYGKDFAIRLSNESDFRVVSNPAAEYTKLVEEAEYFENMDYDWKYLLEHWIGVKNGRIRLLDMGDGRELHATINWIDLTDDSSNNNVKKKRVKRTKPLLKCHYCMLSYNSEKERSAHEALWHTEKMKGI